MQTTKNNFKVYTNQIQSWFIQNHFAQELMLSEREFIYEYVSNIFGFNSLQIGLPQINLLYGNKIANKYIISADILADVKALPFAENSLDLIICPHVFENYLDYQFILAEMYRILVPNGKLIICSLNQLSWLNLFKHHIKALNQLKLINLTEFNQLLTEHNFTIEAGKFFNYRPPFKSLKNLQQFKWLDKVGDRWFPSCANSFVTLVSKDVAGSTIIKPMLTSGINPVIGTSLGTVCSHKK